tara:strand:- start:170 stop:382 length:213 start_codon:yes stop_codon:yes gene_type:complete
MNSMAEDDLRSSQARYNTGTEDSRKKKDIAFTIVLGDATQHFKCSTDMECVSVSVNVSVNDIFNSQPFFA